MSELDVLMIPNGQFAQNCYLLADPASGEAAVVDPGEEWDRILAEARRRGWTIGAIWLTHGHVDHVLGVAEVQEATGAPIWLHPEERPVYDALPAQGRWVGLDLAPLPRPDHDFAAGQHVRVGRFELEVRHTPGHTPGSVSLVGDGFVLAGDALFAGSIGRTDLPGGDHAQLLASIERELLSLPDPTRVLSGHGPETTIGAERSHNPWLTAQR